MILLVEIADGHIYQLCMIQHPQLYYWLSFKQPQITVSNHIVKLVAFKVVNAF